MRENGPVALPVKLAGSTSITVSSATTVYTDAMQLCDLNDFAITYKIITPAIGMDIKIELEQAIVAPATPNAADANYAVPETLAPIEASLTNGNIHHRQLAPVTVEWQRFKITDNAGVDTVLNISLSVQRKWGA